MQNGGNTVGVKALTLWVEKYLLSDKVGPLEKRIIDWWTSEGFFCASSFKETETGVSVELVMFLGGSVYELLSDVQQSKNESVTIKESVQRKIDEGWDLYSVCKPNYFLVLNTEENQKRIRRLIMENFRHYKIERFCIGENEKGMAYIKSVVINVYRNKVKE